MTPGRGSVAGPAGRLVARRSGLAQARRLEARDQDPKEGADYLRVPLRAAAGAEDTRCALPRHPFSIRSIVGHGIKAVGDGDNPGAEGDVGSGQSIRISSSIPALVVAAHNRGAARKRLRESRLL